MSIHERIGLDERVVPTWNEVDQAGQGPDLNILCGLLVGNVSTTQCGCVAAGVGGTRPRWLLPRPAEGGISPPLVGVFGKWSVAGSRKKWDWHRKRPRVRSLCDARQFAPWPGWSGRDNREPQN